MPRRRVLRPSKLKAVPVARPSKRQTPDKFNIRLRIELLGVDPPIWRRIEIPNDYSFWDLHVAIQDSMGWQDTHLHMFQFIGTEEMVGIPDDHAPAASAGWKVKVEDFLGFHTPLCVYEYDFGDSWIHEVRFESIGSVAKGVRYPRCLEGQRRCPPEDSGGPHAYAEHVRALAAPAGPERDESIQWLGGTIDPDEFDVRKVKFDDPAVRLRKAVPNSIR